MPRWAVTSLTCDTPRVLCPTVCRVTSVAGYNAVRRAGVVYAAFVVSEQVASIACCIGTRCMHYDVGLRCMRPLHGVYHTRHPGYPPRGHRLQGHYLSFFLMRRSLLWPHFFFRQLVARGGSRA